MATLEFETSRSTFLAAMGLDPLPWRPARAARPRLAVISTYSDLCGIAGYTRGLERQLGDIFDVTVFDLDQYLLRATHHRVKRYADRHIHDICREIREFDAVNLQLEHGTLGPTPRDIFRRFCWILRAAPRISVTFHTILVAEAFDLLRSLKEIGKGNFKAAYALWSSYFRSHLLSSGIAKRLRRAQGLKPVSVIVHTRRDRARMEYIHGLRNIYDHPLSFLAEADVKAIRDAASRRRFPILDSVPDDAKLVGVFGFLGRYKGFDAAIRALHHLPKEYHLLIFGGVHPNEIRPHQGIDPVLSSLFEAGYVDTSIAERIGAKSTATAPTVSIAVQGAARDLLTDHPKDLSERIHFLGATSDGEFLSGMAICDSVVFPYLEVGQSSSGPISQSLELGCRVIASRTHTFLQFARYHPNMIEFFDIGNHLELAARIASRPQFDLHSRSLAFDTTSNTAVYLAANSNRGINPGAARRSLPTHQAQPIAAVPAAAR
jgi:glycosyltransferase involved in cell wall biosynthesis